MNQATEQIVVEQIGPIMKIQFNRPEKKNAITFAMYDKMTAALQDADQDETVRVIYFTGTDGAYTAGNDLDDFLNRPDSDGPGSAGRFIKQISVMQKPIVAAVTGLAIGVGATMLLHFDLVYASTQAMINFAFIDLGVVPEAASGYLLAATVGPRRASELFLLNERISGTQAHEMGLVNGVLEPAELQVFAWEKAKRLAQKPAGAIVDTKMLMKRATVDLVAEQMATEGEIFHKRVMSAETRAILQRFLSR